MFLIKTWIILSLNQFKIPWICSLRSHSPDKLATANIKNLCVYPMRGAFMKFALGYNKCVMHALVGFFSQTNSQNNIICWFLWYNNLLLAILCTKFHPSPFYQFEAKITKKSGNDIKNRQPKLKIHPIDNVFSHEFLKVHSAVFHLRREKNGLFGSFFQ